MPTYQSLQAGRAAASILVLLFHLGGSVALDRYFAAKSFDTIFSFGDSGVSFFFVLSGFLITAIHWNDFGKPEKLGSFIRKRVIRIYPSYLIVALAVYLVASAIPSMRSSVPQDPLRLLAEATLFPQNAAVTGGTGAGILIVAWSLQYEVFFYALTALLIVRPTVWIVAITILIAANTAVRLGAPDPFPISFFTNESVSLFAYGMVLACIAKSKISISYPVAVACLGLAAFMSLGAFEVSSHRLAHRETWYGLASFFIILGMVRAEDRHPLKPNRVITILGDCSYVLYLIHFPLISVVCKVVRAAGLTGNTGAAVASAVSIVASLAVAIAFTVWVEKPLMRALSKKRPLVTTKLQSANRG